MPNDVSFKNSTNIPGISIQSFPKDVVVWQTWTRFDRRHRGDLLLNVIGLLLRTEDGCYEHKPLVKSRGRYKPINSAKIMLIKGPVPTLYTIVQHSFRVKFRMRRMVSSLRKSLVFPHDYICTSLIVRKSYQL